MADFSISYDIYCFTCELLPLQGEATVEIDFSAAFDAGTGTPATITAIISDGTTVAGVIVGSDVTFAHTFAAAGVYTIILQATFADTAGVSECGPYEITIT